MSRTTFAAAAVVVVAIAARSSVRRGPARPARRRTRSPAPACRPSWLLSSAPSVRADPARVPANGRHLAPTGTMGTPRISHTAVRLLDGRVLVVGGAGPNEENDTSAELYDPVTGTCSPPGTWLRPRRGFGFPATLLRDGKVLVGGCRRH